MWLRCARRRWVALPRRASQQNLAPFLFGKNVIWLSSPYCKTYHKTNLGGYQNVTLEGVISNSVLKWNRKTWSTLVGMRKAVRLQKTILFGGKVYHLGGCTTHRCRNKFRYHLSKRFFVELKSSISHYKDCGVEPTQEQTETIGSVWRWSHVIYCSHIRSWLVSLKVVSEIIFNFHCNKS